MKEQVQIPFDTRGDATEQGKEGKPKALSRPALPQGMEKPRVNTKPFGLAVAAFQRCDGCSIPQCDVPEYDNSYSWDYYDRDNNPVDGGELPKNGPRFLPGQ